MHFANFPSIADFDLTFIIIRRREERIQSTGRESEGRRDSEDQNEPERSSKYGNGVLASTLWRRCQSNIVTAPIKRDSPYPLESTLIATE
jgi:hypothetical protein